MTKTLETTEIKKRYKPIEPKPKNWPVMMLTKNSKEFIQAVIEESIVRIKELVKTDQGLLEELETTLYREQQRVKRNPWKVDPPDDAAFWQGIKSRLITISKDNPNEGENKVDDLLQEIVERYANEILSKFHANHYRVTRSIVKFGFQRLYNASQVKGIGSLWSRKYTLNDKLLITGENEQIRKLAEIGTVVMVPTHFSNIDSILIGWVIHSLGLPPFIYGAGLNLFNIGILAYFMNSLGAYKVDRRKKNNIYIETLKTYSNVAIQKGCHSLFFPGGTRSRSGKIEKNLKRGLLNSVIDAQRSIYQRSHDEIAQKVFIVPVALNYHFVLEAPGMIKEYLKIKGQERYYEESDQYSSSYRILKFLVKFFTKKSNVSVSIGKAMDVLGNYVDVQGNSFDRQGRMIDTEDYFTKNGEVVVDQQRDEEYTKRLGKIIVSEYHRIAQVFASHLAAFVAFQMLQKRYHKLDLYSLLRTPEEDFVISYGRFRAEFDRLRNIILEKNANGEVDIAEHMKGDIDEVIKEGILNLGMYHAQRPLYLNKQGNISSENLSTLYFYNNRLDGYDLEKHF